MHSFAFNRTNDPVQAVGLAARALADGQHPTPQSAVRFVAGGTTLIDLMKLDVEQPASLIDINKLPFDQVEPIDHGGLQIGALVRNADLANHPLVQRDYPVLSLALKSGASAQLRNMASTGGNLLQRTRCLYFRDTTMACNKRQPGSGCAAIGGSNRNLAILGTSEHCIATNPSDMNVALTALDATIVTQGNTGIRHLPIADFYRLPGDTPDKETALLPGELITHVTLPSPPLRARSTYLKLRDRSSYEFALASAAVIMQTDQNVITHIRIAMGGIGTRPWRMLSAEKVLQGAAVTPAIFAKTADVALADARPQSQNGFKVELAKRCLIHALNSVSQEA